MGQKTLNFMGGLTVAIALASVSVYWLPLHRVSFFTGGIVRAMRIETNMLTVKMDAKTSDFCNFINKFRPSTCASGTFALEDMVHRFCAPAIAKMYPQGCSGFQAAHFMGVALSVSLVFNAIALTTVVSVLNMYINGKHHKKSYRTMAFAILCTTTLQLVAVVAGYGLLVFEQLDNMRPTGAAGVMSVAFSANEGVGVSVGYITCACIVVVQLFMLAIWPHTKTSAEQSDDEVRERKLLAAEAGASYGAEGSAAAALQPSNPQADPQAQSLGLPPPPSTPFPGSYATGALDQLPTMQPQMFAGVQSPEQFMQPQMFVGDQSPEYTRESPTGFRGVVQDMPAVPPGSPLA